MQVLVVDDSPVYRKLIGDHLHSWEFEVTVAETGLEAWRVLERPEAPKLVLLDWVMPDLDGIELCRRIRKVGATSQYIYVSCLPAKKAGNTCLKAWKREPTTIW